MQQNILKQAQFLDKNIVSYENTFPQIGPSSEDTRKDTSSIAEVTSLSIDVFVEVNAELKILKIALFKIGEFPIKKKRTENRHFHHVYWKQKPKKKNQKWFCSKMRFLFHLEGKSVNVHLESEIVKQ